MINIVIPMAGRGSRFAGTSDEGPKPLIEVEPGRAMISYVVDHLRLAQPHRFIFVGLTQHAREFALAERLSALVPHHTLVLAEGVTGGPAATTLLAAPSIGADDELIVAYCDCFFTLDMDLLLAAFRSRSADGGVLIYPSSGQMEAYAELDATGNVMRIAEKEVISPDAVAGLYYFRRGGDFVSAARAAVAGAPGTEVFVSTLYNRLIAEGATVTGERIERSQRIEMGTPADLARSRRWLARRTTRSVALAG